MVSWLGGQVVRWLGGQVIRWSGSQVVRWSGGQVVRWSVFFGIFKDSLIKLVLDFVSLGFFTQDFFWIISKFLPE